MFNPIVKVITGQVLAGGRPKAQASGCHPRVEQEYRNVPPWYQYSNGVLRAELKTISWSAPHQAHVGVYFQRMYDRFGNHHGTEEYVWLYRKGQKTELYQTGTRGRRRFVGF